LELKPGFKKTEAGVIPKDWEVMALSALCRTINDGTHFTPHYVTDGIPFYSVENVTANDFEDTKFITEAEHAILTKRCKPQRGDILLTRIGSLGDTKLLNWEVNASIYVSLALLKLNDRAWPDYVYEYSKSSTFVREVEKRSLLNATPKKINMGDIGRIPILVPTSIPEQRSIAEALSDADALIDSLQQLIAKKRHIKHGAIQELLSGKRRLPGFSGEWTAKTLEALAGGAENIVDGPFGSNLKNSDYTNHGIPVLQGLNITDDKFTWKGVRYISRAKARELYRSNAQIGDLLTVKIGSIGFSAIIDDLENNEFAIIPANLLRIRTNKESVDHRFLYFVLSSGNGKKSLRDLAGNTAQPAISLGRLRKLSFLVPALVEEQTAIASVLSDIDAEIAAQEAKLNKARHFKQGMMQELLTGKTRLI
jgi:type I restriction enzyme S subunit